MWEISNSHQLISFLISLLFGVCYAVLYTLFKAVRRAFRHTSFAIFLEDIIFFQIISFITFLLFLAFSSGEIRFFMLLGIFLGFAAFYFTLADILSRALAYVLRLISRVYRWFSSLFSAVFGFFSKMVGKTASYCGKKLRICYKYLKKPLKQRAQMVYTNENEQSRSI